jgi:hypothetical protein
MEGGQQPRRALQELQRDVGAVQFGIVPTHQQVLELRQCSRRLDSGRPATHHDHAQAWSRSAGHGRVLQSRDETLAQPGGVDECVQRQGVSGGAIHPEEVGGRPGGQDQMVEAKHGAVLETDRVAFPVHFDDTAPDEPARAHPAQQAPHRKRHILQIQPTGRHLIEKRLEGGVLVPIDQRCVEAGPGQLSQHGQPSKAGPDDDQPPGTVSSRRRSHLNSGSHHPTSVPPIRPADRRGRVGTWKWTAAPGGTG